MRLWKSYWNRYDSGHVKKARENAEKHEYKNVDFREGDIEQRILLEMILWT
ncbi:MAG: hypothetical protein R2685_02770 [Candidatus Nitrosocosmicus sp.]|nr:hypothetical protein [Candidatus Nitrosocosmicus sp.]